VARKGSTASDQPEAAEGAQAVAVVAVHQSEGLP